MKKTHQTQTIKKANIFYDLKISGGFLNDNNKIKSDTFLVTKYFTQKLNQQFIKTNCNETDKRKK